jgi:hypothetical protein
MKLYREVKCSDRLPKKEGEYMVLLEDGAVQHEPFKPDLGWWVEYHLPGTDKVISWLEPYEPPTEEEIHEIVSKYLGIDWDMKKDCEVPYFTMKGAKAIINLLER